MQLPASSKQYFIHNLPLLWKSEREPRSLTLRSEDSGWFVEWEVLNIGPKILQNSGIRWGSSVSASYHLSRMNSNILFFFIPLEILSQCQ